MPLQDYLIKSAQEFPDKEALIQAGSRTTYREILHGASAMARWLLSENLQYGDRVAILSDNPPEYVMAYFGILMAGGVAVPLNTQTSAGTLQYLFNHCGISVLFTQTNYLKYLNELRDALPTLTAVAMSVRKDEDTRNLPCKCTNLDVIIASQENELPQGVTARISDSDLAQITYTSGTTGKPKGVMLRHSNLMANTDSIIRYLRLNRDERHMVVLPFFYSFGNSILLSHFAVKASMVVHQNLVYPNVVLDLMVREKATGFSGVPSTYAILLNRSALSSYAFPHLKYCTQAGGAMSPKLAQMLKKVLPNVDIYIMYGQTEACARLSYLEPADLIRKAGSIGKAIPNVKLDVLNQQGNPVKPGETGEIVAQGKNIMAGYWNDPEGTRMVLKKEGLWTGDLARMDEEGYLYIVSRKSDMIKSGAHRIAPKEIEDSILEHEAVHEVAVLGVDDEILGEAIRACIVLKEGKPCSKKEIQSHCHKRLPAYKVPHQIIFCEQLPKTSSGKIKKSELKADIPAR
jgi:acyl-CoA synthetase (AMP-forming)/AMP-acid ligase II